MLQKHEDVMSLSIPYLMYLYSCSCALIMTERFGFGAQKSKLIRNIIIKLLHQFQGWNFSKDVSLSSSWKG